MIVLVLWAATAAQAQSAADSAAIRQPALDYIEGWYEADAERMERALHPDLAKRIVRTNPENTASVKLVANGWVDYLHVARFNGRWVIVNVLWELKPKK
jgi:hypothetical protein